MSGGKYECTLGGKMLERAIKELNEDPTTRHIEVQTLRERLQKVPGYSGRTDDSFLLRFLRCKKFDQEVAFKQVLAFYTIRREHPDLFHNLTPLRVRHVLDNGVTGVLKDRAPDGSRVIVFSVGKWDPDKGPLTDVTASNFLTMCKLIEEEETQVCGITVLADFNLLGMHHVTHMKPIVARKIAALIQESFPARFKALHYLNEPRFFDIFFAILKPFLKEKILKRMHMHGHHFETLHKFIPADMLPEDYGGKLPPLCNKEWNQHLLACEAQFVAENKFGLLDMTIPHKTSQKADATDTMAGSFRKLNVD